MGNGSSGLNCRKTDLISRPLTAQDLGMGCIHLHTSSFAKQLNVASITIYKWCERGALPHFRLQGCIRLSQEDVDNFVQERRVEIKKKATGGDS